MTKRQAFVALYAQKLIGHVTEKWRGNEHALAEKISARLSDD